eukprot:TRINITY_DN5551_c0_g2_i1.p1 TRINITY_DN5551_c0_g2~~TRINITY_DN5551_c0_g2_i1.p1  ORF type:complete len:300 (-),score=80.60 TRINITY_DN5551_c0_g2_i1:101-1000(-)
MAAVIDKASAKQRWCQLFRTALDADKWGQVMEASDGYRMLGALIDSQERELGLTVDESSIVQKLRICLQLRVTALNDITLNQQRMLQLDSMRALSEVFESLFTRQMPLRFPVDLSQYQDEIMKPAQRSDAIAEGKVTEEPVGGKLLPPPRILQSGLTTLEIEIEKIGLKDASTYIDAFITVSVVDSAGNVIEAQQDLPVSNRKLAPNYVLFGQTVYLQTPLQQMPDPNFCLFFEFKHYKPDKKKISTRCFAFMERDEIQPSNNIQLELYKKPTDFKRQDINLFTVKPLYLHLKLALRHS